MQCIGCIPSFHAWLNRSPSARSRSDEAIGQRVRASFIASDRTYGARRVWRDLLAEGVDCGLHRIERLMRLQALRARPRRRRLPKDEGDRRIATMPSNLLDRQFAAELRNQKSSLREVLQFVSGVLTGNSVLQQI